MTPPNRQSRIRNSQREAEWRRIISLTGESSLPPNHNGGPPLDDPDDHVPAWGNAGLRTYFGWKRAYDQVWKSVPHAIMLRRVKKAKACGLTYEEYTLHLLDTGRYLQPSDHDIIADILARRTRSSKMGDRYSSKS